MYNVLACDDEQIAIDSLKFIFEKNFQGEVNLFTASSGPEALSVVNSQAIDIIFMDINMPGMTGLETVSCILNMKPDTVVIILSAFDKFQYAQEALNMGAFRYITKPVNRNTIIQTARNAMNRVDELRGGDSNSEELQKKLESISPMIESDFIYSCVFSLENENLSPYLEYFNIQDQTYLFVVMELPDELTDKKLEISSKIRLMANENARCIMGSFMANRLFLFFAFPKTSFVENKAIEEIKHIHTLVTLQINRNIKTGVSTFCTSDVEFSDKYKEAVSEIISIKDNKSEKISFAGTGDKIPEATPFIRDTKDISDRILARLSIGDAEGVQYLAGLFLDSLESEKMDYSRFLVMELLINVKNLTLKAAPDFLGHSFDNSFRVISEAQTTGEMQNYLKQRLADCTVTIQNAKYKNENPVIKKTCEFIAMHLSSDISLEDAAKAAGVSPFYLSKLFKEEMNETFINYVTEKKMEKAKNLLKESDLSIKEITAACGYNDQNYFSKIFKNRYDISPSEFKRMNND